jgi:RecB family exonuclease
MRQCPHKHWLGYVQRWKEPGLSTPLATGILWHSVLEHHYRGLKDDTLPEALEAIIELLDGAGARNPEHPTHAMADIVAWMYDGYRQRWEQDDRSWEIIDVEGEFTFVLPSGIHIVGRYDLLIRTMKRYLWVVDHKSGSALPTGKDLDLDDQTPLYISGIQKAMGIKVRGAMYNSARTKRLVRPMTMGERFHRELMHRTPHELQRVIEEADATAIRAKAQTPEVPGERHPDPQQCVWRCPFTEACIGGRKNGHSEREILLAKGFFKKPART